MAIKPAESKSTDFSDSFILNSEKLLWGKPAAQLPSFI